MALRQYLAVGLMSGTSMDGVDAALLATDGEARVEPGGFLTVPYDAGFRRRLRGTLGRTGSVAAVERALTLAHAEAVRSLLAQAGVEAGEVDVVGFHGHTILHDPARGRTRQIGDGALLAQRVRIPVINDFRSADVAGGGEGAPLAPAFHRAIAAGIEGPLAILNIGGVANVTWIGEDGRLISCDTGPGNALIDDWVLAHTGRPFDDNGRLAAAGGADEAVIAQVLNDPYFARRPPKSLDREAFSRVGTLIAGKSTADGAATVTLLTAAAVGACLRHLTPAPRRWLVTGGGRHNGLLIQQLAQAVGAPVQPIEAIGWSGDALEAQAFAYLAVRSLNGWPISFPETTGVKRPTAGGRLHPVG